MENKYLYKIPHKTLAVTRVVKLELKLPKNLWKNSPVINDNSLKKKNNYQTFLRYFQESEKIESPLKSSTVKKLNRWTLPQRLETNSPEEKELIKVKELIKSEAKLDKISRKISPDVDFFRQTFRPPMPKPVLHEVGMYKNKEKADNLKTQKTKIVFFKEVKDFDFKYQKSSKSFLKTKYFM